MVLSKAFIHLDAALRFPDGAWRHQMENLPVSLPSPGQRRPSSQLDGPWVAVISGPGGSGKTTLYRSRLARLWVGVPFVESLAQATDLAQDRQDFIWETGLLGDQSLSFLDTMRSLDYKIGLLVLDPGTLDVQATQSVPPGSASTSSRGPKDEVNMIGSMVEDALGRVHALWWLDSSLPHQPPQVKSRWVQGSQVR